MNPDKHPSDQEIEQMATKQDTESKSGKEKDRLLQEKHLILQKLLIISHIAAPQQAALVNTVLESSFSMHLY